MTALIISVVGCALCVLVVVIGVVRDLRGWNR